MSQPILCSLWFPSRRVLFRGNEAPGVVHVVAGHCLYTMSHFYVLCFGIWCSVEVAMGRKSKRALHTHAAGEKSRQATRRRQAEEAKQPEQQSAAAFRSSARTFVTPPAPRRPTRGTPRPPPTVADVAIDMNFDDVMLDFQGQDLKEQDVITSPRNIRPVADQAAQLRSLATHRFPRTWRTVMNRVVLLVFLGILVTRPEFTMTQAVASAAFLTFAGEQRVRDVYSAFRRGISRGAASPTVPNTPERRRQSSGTRQRALTQPHLDAILEIVDTQNKERGHCTVRSITNALIERFQTPEDPTFSVSRKIVRYAMKVTLGLQWTRTSTRKGKRDRSQAHALRRLYVAWVAHYLKDPDVVFVFQDESYCDTAHCPKYSWTRPDQTDVGTKKGAGQHTCVLSVLYSIHHCRSLLLSQNVS